MIKKVNNFILIAVLLCVVQLLSCVTAYSYDVVKSTLAGFKIHTVVVNQDNEKPVTSTISTNNSLIKKFTVNKPEITKTKASNVTTTRKNYNKAQTTPKSIHKSGVPASKSSLVRGKTFRNTRNIKPAIHKNTADVVKHTIPIKESTKKPEQVVKSPVIAKTSANAEEKQPVKSSDEVVNLTGNQIEYSTKGESQPLSKKIATKEKVKAPSIINMMSSLFVVILLIIIFGGLYKKFSHIDAAALLAGKLKAAGEGKFSLLSTTSLGQGKSIHLVEIKGKQLVIGSTTNNINLLTEFNPDNVKQQIPENDTEEKEVKSSYIAKKPSSIFPEIYKEYLNKEE